MHVTRDVQNYDFNEYLLDFCISDIQIVIPECVRLNSSALLVVKVQFFKQQVERNERGQVLGNCLSKMNDFFFKKGTLSNFFSFLYQGPKCQMDKMNHRKKDWIENISDKIINNSVKNTFKP